MTRRIIFLLARYQIPVFFTQFTKNSIPSSHSYQNYRSIWTRLNLFVAHFSVKFYDDWYTNKSHFAKDYVFPDKITTLNYVESPCEQNESPFILIIVCSNLENGQLRQSIRDTWASHAKDHNIHVLFLVGQSTNSNLDVNIK